MLEEVLGEHGDELGLLLRADESGGWTSFCSCGGLSIIVDWDAGHCIVEVLEEGRFEKVGLMCVLD